MRTASPARRLSRALLLLPVALLYGCSDASAPLAPPSDLNPLASTGTVLTVTNTYDSGPGSLRQAIIDAPNDATIQFDPSLAGQTIVISTGILVLLNQTYTIEGPVPGGITLSGNHTNRILGSLVSTTLTLRNLALVDGVDTPVGNGGGAFNMGGSVLMDHVLLAGNQSLGKGGAVFVRPGASLTLVNSTVSGNVAESGGGIAVEGTLTVWNSTITNNRANSGGGLLLDGSGGEGTLFLRNSIVANNTIFSGVFNCQPVGGPTVHLAGSNLSDDDSCSGDPALLRGNPTLGPLADNGGPTWTHALLVGSKAIDAGVDCTETTDQRYVARNQGVTCDLGAYEFDSYATASLKLSPNAAIAKTGVATVSGTITCSAGGTFTLNVWLSQTQKTGGRFSTIIQGAAQTTVACNGTSSWSTTVTPFAGKFQGGGASAKVNAGDYPVGYIAPADVAGSVKLFQVK